jgi:hypothetical protein
MEKESGIERMGVQLGGSDMQSKVEYGGAGKS